MATTLSEWEIGPFNAGVNRSVLASEIDDNEAYVIQDMLLDIPGEIRTRGQIKNVVQNAATFAPTTKVVRGFFSVVDPSGATQLATVAQDTGSTNLYFTALNQAGNAVGISVTLDSAFPIASDCLVDAKPALGGGVWVGTQELPSAAAQAGRQCLFHWRGATKALYSTGTFACTSGSAVITGTGTTWLANVSPGMFLFLGAGLDLVGVVKTVDSNTQVTLETATAWPTSTGNTYELASIRGFGNLEASKGRITGGPAGASTTVVGSGTKFLSQPFSSALGAPNNYLLFRAKDNMFLGTVSSVQGEEGLTLGAGIGVALDNEPYTARVAGYGNFHTYLIPTTTATFNGAFPGPLNATYSGLQWFARQDGPPAAGTGDLHSRVWFSDYRNMNSLDLLTQDGDFVQVPSTVGQNVPIRAIAPSVNALLIFKENETFAITGDSPDTFELNKIWDDGCLSQMSVVTAHGTVIWAGRNGIYQYDGTKIINLVARSLGQSWKDWVKYFDPRIHKMVAAYYQDHYFLTIVSHGSGNFTQVSYSILKNGTQSVPAGYRFAYCINVPTKALTFIGNMSLRGYAVTNQTTFFVTYNGDSYVSDFDVLFAFPNGKDYPDIVAAPYFPDPYIETKRMSMKDPLRKKWFKWMMATLDSSSAVTLEIAPNLIDSTNPTAWTVTTIPIPTTSMVPITTRLKFLKRHQFIGLKLYCDTSATYGRFNLRRLAVGYKWMRPGRF